MDGREMEDGLTTGMDGMAKWMEGRMDWSDEPEAGFAEVANDAHEQFVNDSPPCAKVMDADQFRSASADAPAGQSFPLGMALPPRACPGCSRQACRADASRSAAVGHAYERERGKVQPQGIFVRRWPALRCPGSPRRRFLSVERRTSQVPGPGWRVAVTRRIVRMQAGPSSGVRCPPWSFVRSSGHAFLRHALRWSRANRRRSTSPP